MLGDITTADAIYIICGLSSAFGVCPIIIAKIISKLRIIIILFHRSLLILPHHPAIQLFQIHQHDCFPWLLSAFQSMEMRICGSFEWKYVPVFWIQVQVQLHFDIVHKPWFFGAYVDTAFAEVQDNHLLCSFYKRNL